MFSKRLAIACVVMTAGMYAFAPRCAMAASSDDATTSFPAFVDPTLDPAPVSAISVATPPSNIEQTMIPLPPGAWTGLAGLASLALASGRKSIVKLFR
jgi:hypothetical protein